MPDDIEDYLDPLPRKPSDPVSRVHTVARRINVSPEIADDYLNLTGKVESGNRQFTKSGSVLTGPPTRTGSKARGMGQVMPDKPGGMTRTIAGKVHNLADPEQNVEAGLKLFNAGGADPVGRRLEYFGGAGARRQYERTGRIPSGGDGYTTFNQYVQKSMGPSSISQTQRPASDVEKYLDPPAAPRTDELSRTAAAMNPAAFTPAPDVPTPVTPPVTQAAPLQATSGDLIHHFGFDQAEWDALTRKQKRQASGLAAEAAAEDQRKRAAGQTDFTPNAGYHAQMRARIGIKPRAVAPDPNEDPRTGNVPNLSKMVTSMQEQARIPRPGMGIADLRQQDERAIRIRGDVEEGQRIRNELARQEGNLVPAFDVNREVQRRVEAEQLAEDPEEIARRARVAKMTTGEKAMQIPKSIAQGVSTLASGALKTGAMVEQAVGGGFGHLAMMVAGDGAPKEASENPLYTLGAAIEKKLPEVLGSNPDLEQEMLYGKLPAGAGNMIAFVAGGMATKGSKIAIAAIGAGMEAPVIYDEIKAGGGSENEALAYGLIGGGILGSTEIIGFTGALNAMKGTAGELLVQSAAKRAIHAGKETGKDIVLNAVQEAGQTYGEGVFSGKARGGQEIAEAALIGGALGGVTTGALTGYNAVRPPRPGAVPIANQPNAVEYPQEGPIFLPVDRPTVPESKATIAAQIDAMQRGLRGVVVIPPGAKGPTKLPKGYTRTRSPDGGQIIHATENAADIAKSIKDGTLYELMGHVNPDTSPGPKRIVIAYSGREYMANGVLVPAGTELQSSYVDPGNEQLAMAEMQSQFAPYNPYINVGGEETAADAVNQRSGDGAQNETQPNVSTQPSQVQPEQDVQPSALDQSGQVSKEDRFKTLSNQQLEAHVAKARKEGERRLSRLATRPGKGVSKETRQALPRRIARGRARLEARLQEAQAELDRRRAGTDTVPSFEQWIQTEAGGVAGGVDPATLSTDERSQLQTRYDEQYYGRRQSRRERRIRAAKPVADISPSVEAAKPATETLPPAPSAESAGIPQPTRRSPLEQARRDLQAERSKLIQDAAKALSKEEHFSIKGDPVATKRVLERHLKWANDHRSEFLRKMEPAERATLEKEFPEFTAENISKDIQTEGAAAPKVVQTEARAQDYKPEVGESITWQDGDKTRTGKVEKVLPSGRVKVRVTGKTDTARRLTLPADTEFQPHTVVAKAQTHVTGRPRLDPTTDSLERAIRAGGGIRDDGSGELAVLKQSGKSGLVTPDGKPQEEMAQWLREHGYGANTFANEQYGKGIDAAKMIEAAIEDASGHKKHYSTEYEQDTSEQLFEQDLRGLEPAERQQWETGERFIQSPKVARLMEAVADGTATDETYKKIREAGKARGLDQDTIVRYVASAQAEAKARHGEVSGEAQSGEETDGTEGRALEERRQADRVSQADYLDLTDEEKVAIRASLEAEMGPPTHVDGVPIDDFIDPNTGAPRFSKVEDAQTPKEIIEALGHVYKGEQERPRGKPPYHTFDLGDLKGPNGAAITLTRAVEGTPEEMRAQVEAAIAEKRAQFGMPPLQARKTGTTKAGGPLVTRDGTRLTINQDALELLHEHGIFPPNVEGATFGKAYAEIYADKLKQAAKAKPEPAGQDVDDYEGKVPKHDWNAADNPGLRTHAAVAKEIGVPADEYLYRAMVDLGSDLKPARVEKIDAADTRAGKNEPDQMYLDDAEAMLEEWGELESHHTGDKFEEWRDALPWSWGEGYTERDVKDLAKEMQARSEEGSYDDDELSQPYGKGFPPIVVTRKADGTMQIEDGNHRADIWNEQGYDVAPAWVNDEQARKQAKDGKALRRLARQLTLAANETVPSPVVMATPGTRIHELSHESSDRASGMKALQQKHAPAGFKRLTSHAAWADIQSGLNRMGYDASDVPTAVDEAYAHIVEGRYASLGLDRMTALDWLQQWFSSFAEAGGDISTKHFEEIGNEANRIREAAAQARDGQRRTSGEDIRGVEEGRQGSAGEDGTPRAGRSDEDIATEPKKRRVISTAIKQQVANRYRDGDPMAQIASDFNITLSAVHRYAKEAGIPNRSLLPDDEKGRALDLFEKGLTVNAIAKEIGRDWQTIRKYLNAQGVEVPSPLEHDQAVKDEAVRLYSTEEMSTREVAVRLGIGPQAVKNIVRRAGVTRTRSEAAAIGVTKRPSGGFLQALWHSSKTNEWSFAGSSYELVRMSQLDDDPNVVSWTRKVDRVPYGEGRNYVPDFLVEYVDGHKVIEEVKPLAHVSREDVTVKAESAKRFFGDRGIDYRIVTEDDIGLDNIKDFDYASVPSLYYEQREVLRKQAVADAKRRYELRETAKRKAEVDAANRQQPLFARRFDETSEQWKERLRQSAAERGTPIPEPSPRREAPAKAATSQPATQKPVIPPTTGAVKSAALQPPTRHVPGERSFPKTAERSGFRGGTDRDYTIITDQEALEAADRKIARMGTAKAAADLYASEEPTKHDGALGILLIQRFEKAGNLNEAVRVANDLSRKYTTAGQFVQSASIITHLSPEGVLLAAQKRMKGGRVLSEETARTVVAQAREVTEAEKRIAEIQKARPDIFGPNGEILPAVTRLNEPRDSGTRPVTRKRARERIGKLQDRLSAMEADARARLVARTGVVQGPKGEAGATTIIPDIADYAIIGAAKLARKGIEKAVWFTEMASEIGLDAKQRADRKALRDLYRASYAEYEAQRKQFLQESRERGAEKQEGRPLDPQERHDVINARLESQKRAQKARRELERTFKQLNRTATQRVTESGTGLRRANLLTAAKTHIRNITSNIAFQATETISRPLAAMADMAAMRIKGTGVRTTTGLDLPADVRATISAALKEGPRRAASIILGREVLPLEGYGKQKESIQSKMQLGTSDTGIPLLDLYINTVFRSLEAEDAVFKVYAFSRELADIARSQARTERSRDKTVNVRTRAKELRANPTDAMLMEAAAYADYATFQNDNAISGAIRTGKSHIGPVGRFAVETLAPFDRTPTNILYRTFENSPLGLISAAQKFRNIGNTRGRELSGKPTARAQFRGEIDAITDAAFTRAEQKAFARTFGRAATGTLFAALALTLAAKGLLIGSADYDDDKAEYFRKRHQFGGGAMLKVPFTSQYMYIGDNPVGKAMGTVAGMYEQVTKKRKPNESRADYRDRKVTGAMKSVARLALDQPLLQGTQDLMRGTSMAERAGNYAGSMIPGSMALQHIGDVIDPEARRTYGEGFTAQIKKVIPKPNRYGRQSLSINTGVNKEERGRLTRRMLRSLDPFNTTTEGKGPVTRRAQR